MDFVLHVVCQEMTGSRVDAGYWTHMYLMLTTGVALKYPLLCHVKTKKTSDLIHFNLKYMYQKTK